MGGRPATRRSRSRPTLRRALAYRNDQIVYKFMSNWDVTEADAHEVFTETKRMLWVKDISESRGHPFDIGSALRVIDEMWHTFVLFTAEYAAYCERTFGRFLHHKPTTRADREGWSRDHARDPEAFARVELERNLRQWRLITEVAGEPTLLKWYVDLPLRFGPQFFEKNAIVAPMTYRPPAALVQMLAVSPRPRARGGRGARRSRSRSAAA